MIKITGLDELSKKISDMASAAQEVNGTQRVPVTDLLNDSFVSANSRFANADEMFSASGFKIESQADFEAIPDDAWDDFIRSNTSFDDWQSMLGEAATSWLANKIGL